MSYNDDSGRRDYRGRGKKAAGHYKGKHFKSASSDEGLVPIGNTAVEARVGKHDKAPEPKAPVDPFAPKDSYAPEGTSAAREDEASTASSSSAEAPVEHTAQMPATEVPSAPHFAEDDADSNEDANPDASDASSDFTVPERDDSGASAPDSASSEPSPEAAQYARGDEKYTKHKPGFSRGQKIAIVVVAIIAAVVFAIAGVAFAFWQDTQSSIALSDESIKDELTPTVSNEQPYWTLIMGSDSRTTDTKGTRSDVVMLVRIDEPNKQVTLVSIPRDTYVTINGTPEKINAAYAVGGSKQMIQTVQDFAGIKISHYAEVYFKGFSDLVDDLGGVDVVVPETGSYDGVTIKKGKQHLNGKEALTFARIRKSYATGDFRRTQCQRILVQALAKKILSQDITQIPGIIQSASDCFSTDMSMNEIVNIATWMKGMDTDDMYSAMTPSTTGMINGVSYTFTYNYQWILMMQKANNGENPKVNKKEAEICGTQSTPTYPLDMSAGLPQTVQAELQQYWDQKDGKKSGKGKSSSGSSSSSTASSSASKSSGTGPLAATSGDSSANASSN